jgi:hypothetical protein
MYSYSNKIRFIEIILSSSLYRSISVDAMRSVFLFHILNDVIINKFSVLYSKM